MGFSLTQEQGADLFGIPVDVIYVCDGMKECGKPCCKDFSRRDVCHHTHDKSHALYADHDIESFTSHPSTSRGKAVTILVEPFRG